MRDIGPTVLQREVFPKVLYEDRRRALCLLDPLLQWEPHIWMGVSIENAKYLHRVDDLRQTRSHVKFLSVEPLLGPLHDLDPRYRLGDRWR